MILLHAWISVLTALGFLWQECGQDFGVFCYRIGCNFFTFAHRRALELVPVRHTINGNLARTNAACSNPSFTFSNPSMIRGDFES